MSKYQKLEQALECLPEQVRLIKQKITVRVETLHPKKLLDRGSFDHVIFGLRTPEQLAKWRAEQFIHHSLHTRKGHLLQKLAFEVARNCYPDWECLLLEKKKSPKARKDEDSEADERDTSPDFTLFKAPSTGFVIETKSDVHTMNKSSRRGVSLGLKSECEKRQSETGFPWTSILSVVGSNAVKKVDVKTSHPNIELGGPQSWKFLSNQTPDAQDLVIRHVRDVYSSVVRYATEELCPELESRTLDWIKNHLMVKGKVPSTRVDSSPKVQIPKALTVWPGSKVSWEGTALTSYPQWGIVSHWDGRDLVLVDGRKVSPFFLIEEEDDHT